MVAVLPEVRDARAQLTGFMDDDAAAAAAQLFGSGPRGLLVIDHRELLASTARVVGVTMGELHFKVWMALVTMHVANGMPADGRASATVSDFVRLLWSSRERGGKNTRMLLRVLLDLREARFTIPGWDVVNQRPAAGISDTSLLINLFVDDTVMGLYTGELASKLDRVEVGRRLGRPGPGALAWRLHPDYTQRLAAADLRRFDWSQARALRGVALALWMLFTSPRVPFRAAVEHAGDLQVVDVELSVDHCHALGARAATDAARRRTLNDAGMRVCAADHSFVSFEAHGGRGRPSFLRVVRQAPALEQLTLAAV